ncbi:NAD-dependent epimerase/dehydratase family protein [Pusillimonas sp. CC-YST705]|uniref:NAD-dependent epimerase/dehydratase family protein n=1 Tax=Mesopusillimonas faecipullorum TaxID=2755040 RepID=A0ABS8CEU5_9BURK|nr:NAD-dependent epimerase/dehydratase family protein [Mesopusillimonas faecipullorum]MCB5364556.1 NAD-dependent epimerase/dehydratase family protein [Mesopusillimonas faecipullorum]
MTCRVLVLGARGYFGTLLLQRLRQLPWVQAVGAGRRYPTQHDGGFRVFDAVDAEALRCELEDFDAVINCVSGSADVISGGARALREAIGTKVGAGPRLVHFSSMAVYGSIQGKIREDCPLNGDLGPYASAKVRAEQYLSDMPDVFILRPGCIYGKGSPQWTSRIAKLLRAGRIGDLGAEGDGCSNLVFADDVVQAVIAALRAPAGQRGAYNLAMPDAPSWNLYFERMACRIGAVPLKRISARRLKLETKLLAPAFKVAELVGGRAGLRDLPPPIPASLARLWRQDIQLDTSRASNAWQLSWTSLDEGLRLSFES